MRELKDLTPAQKMRSPFVAKVIFWNKSKYQNRHIEWNFRSDMCPNVTRNSTIREHLEHLIKFLKTDILRNYGFELCTIFENMNFLSNYENTGIKKNIVLQCSETSLYYDNRDKFDFDSLIKNNEFYITESWNEEVMLISLDKSFVVRMRRSFIEQGEEMAYHANRLQKVYQNYRKTWDSSLQCNSNLIAN